MQSNVRSKILAIENKVEILNTKVENKMSVEKKKSTETEFVTRLIRQEDIDRDTIRQGHHQTTGFDHDEIGRLHQRMTDEIDALVRKMNSEFEFQKAIIMSKYEIQIENLLRISKLQNYQPQSNSSKVFRLVPMLPI